MKHWISLGLLCAAQIAFAAQEVELGCKRLRVTLDARLTPSLVEQEWGSGNERSETPAILELIGCQGRLLDRLILDSPLARLDPEPLRGAPNPTFLVSADLTAAAGSYNGPLTIPIQVVADHLVAVVARDADGRDEAIHLALTGKSAWRKVSSRNVEHLLQVSCQPRNQGFVTLYRRYFPTGRRWKVKARVSKGLWEADGEFPGENLFPSHPIRRGR